MEYMQLLIFQGRFGMKEARIMITTKNIIMKAF